MVNALRVLVAVVVGGLALAVPARADENDYLAALQSKYTFLSTQQLLSAGHQVCDATRGGMASADAANMLQKDFAVSVPVSVDIVSAAAVHLGC